ncbi:hypothetical protein B0H19DRAFT_1075872 [Mycena capillaripes]|nr:hypothetical protein B0H19DRAFT_1075872 [Mycena capillaripes]
MSDSSNAYRIKLLEGAQGYPTWATKIMDILTELEYDEYITGSLCEKPVVANQIDTATVSALKEWEKKQRKALTVIRLHVAEGPMAYIQRATTGVEAWNKLQSANRPNPKPESDDTALPAHSGSSSGNDREGACFHC